MSDTQVMYVWSTAPNSGFYHIAHPRLTAKAEWAEKAKCGQTIGVEQWPAAKRPSPPDVETPWPFKPCARCSQKSTTKPGRPPRKSVLAEQLLAAWNSNNFTPGSEQRIMRVFQTADYAHRNQTRKYSGVPYIHHPVAVAIAACHAGMTETAVSAALLHDTIEDTNLTATDIESEFGNETAELVWALTDQCHDGNRAARKKAEADRYRGESHTVQTLKLLDMCDNTPSIVVNDPKFGRTYLVEKAYLLDCCFKPPPSIRARARSLIEACDRHINPTEEEA